MSHGISTLLTRNLHDAFVENVSLMVFSDRLLGHERALRLRRNTGTYSHRNIFGSLPH
ncbi:MAG TPA: hypothetical protein VK789_02460 [Bryobacteraceae bacterium]|jgi:hypothetical protein|nr:hypothetical protein [Bryobacteraceae bacterium]